MKDKFNNYTLSNEEIERILNKYQHLIRYAATIDGKLDDECEQRIRIEIYRKLSRNRKK